MSIAVWVLALLVNVATTGAYNPVVSGSERMTFLTFRGGAGSRRAAAPLAAELTASKVAKVTSTKPPRFGSEDVKVFRSCSMFMYILSTFKFVTEGLTMSTLVWKVAATEGVKSVLLIWASKHAAIFWPSLIDILVAGLLREAAVFFDKIGTSDDDLAPLMGGVKKVSRIFYRTIPAGLIKSIIACVATVKFFRSLP